MSRPLVFISSTHKDLKFLREALKPFVEQLGFEPLMSEAGNITLKPGEPLDESCYREVKRCDIFVVLIGARYGSPASAGRKLPPSSAILPSITRMEYQAAVAEGKPRYVCIERDVLAEYRTFAQNTSATRKKALKPAHVETANVHDFIGEVLNRNPQDPILPFSGIDDIQTFLRQQWAGLFAELLQRRHEDTLRRPLSEQIATLAEIVRTLGLAAGQLCENGAAAQKPKSTTKAPDPTCEVLAYAAYSIDPHWMSFARYCALSLEDLFKVIIDSTSLDDFLGACAPRSDSVKRTRFLVATQQDADELCQKLNKIRAALDRPLLK